MHSRLWLERQLAARPLVPAYSAPKELNGAAAVIAVPFNCYLNDDPPDRSNFKIAEIAAKYIDQYNLPFFGQREHTNLLKYWQNISEHRWCPIKEFASKDGERVMSQRLVRWQAQQVREFGRYGNKVILVGMPEHLGRVKLLCEYFGLDPKIPKDCAQVPYDPSDRPGAQDWCKTRQDFTRYELRTGRLGTIAYALLGLV